MLDPAKTNKLDLCISDISQDIKGLGKDRKGQTSLLSVAKAHIYLASTCILQRNEPISEVTVTDQNKVQKEDRK